MVLDIAKIVYIKYNKKKQQLYLYIKLVYADAVD